MAGGKVRIGIESLSEAFLVHGEGRPRVFECLRLLKWCRAEGLRCFWNILSISLGDDDHLIEIMQIVPLHGLTPPKHLRAHQSSTASAPSLIRQKSSAPWLTFARRSVRAHLSFGGMRT